MRRDGAGSGPVFAAPSIMRLPVLVSVSLLFVSASSAHADDITLRVPKPRIGIAGSIGQTYVGDSRDARSVGLEGRLSFGRVEFAGEVAKSEYNDDSRIDRRLGGSMYVHLGRGELRPVLSVGGGLLRADMSGGLISYDMAYGQAGVGLLRRLSDQVDLSVEAVLGRRWTVRNNSEVLPLLYYIYFPDEEDFGRLQLKLIVRL